MWATDISSAALQTARQNAESLNLAERVLFTQDDLAGKLLEDLNAGLAAELAQAGGFDVLVSNPPYIPSELLPNLPNEVREFEPLAALDGGQDGLEIFRVLAAQAAELLTAGGLLALELHESRVQAAADFLANLPFTQVETHNDISGRPRFLTALRRNGDQ